MRAAWSVASTACGRGILLSERASFYMFDCGLFTSGNDSQMRGHVACGTFEHSWTAGTLQEYVDLLCGSILSIPESTGTLERGFVEGILFNK